MLKLCIVPIILAVSMEIIGNTNSEEMRTDFIICIFHSGATSCALL